MTVKQNLPKTHQNDRKINTLHTKNKKLPKNTSK